MSEPIQGSRVNSGSWKKLRAQVLREETHCHICLEPVDQSIPWPEKECAVVDHIVPVALGGLDQRENLVIAHNSCNLSKGKKDINAVRATPFSREW